MKGEYTSKTIVSGHKCAGYQSWTDYGYEYDCEYEPDFSCDDCVFVVGYQSKDYRKGKRPWSRLALNIYLKGGEKDDRNRDE